MERPGLVLLAAAAAVVVGLGQHYAALYNQSVVDDALISLQYTRNLIDGEGLVFNPGERVEGYTNFLWVVVLAPVMWLSRLVEAPVLPLVHALNLSLAVGALALVHAIGKQRWPGRLWPTGIALGLCVVDNSYVVWAVLGLESHLLAALMLVSCWLARASVSARGPLLGLALTATHLTRPDAGLFCVALLAGVWAASRGAVAPSDAPAHRWRHAWLLALLTWGATYGAYFAWRYSYYGWLLPNTYYVKVGGGGFDGWARGFQYVSAFWSERLWLPLVAPLLAWLSRHPVDRAVGAYVALHTLYVVYIGGDYFAGHRFFVAQLPLFALGIASGADAAIGALSRGWAAIPTARSVSPRRPSRVLLIAGSVAVLVQLFIAGRRVGPLQGEIRAHAGLVRINRNFMRWLADHKPQGATIATCAIGSAGFDGRFDRVIDTCGIIDPVIAHRRVAGFGSGVPGHEKFATRQEILAQRPTYIDRLGRSVNYWPAGYYVDARMRIALGKTVEGIWRRDPLLERGAYLSTGGWSFTPGELAGFYREGSAFRSAPTRQRPAEQYPGIGERTWHINSFGPTMGDLPQGLLRSPPFPLIGDLMVLRVGGGHDPERLRVTLLVDGRRVHAATGMDSEHLSRRVWDIARYRGRSAVLEMLDASGDPAGHILVDEVRQWRRHRTGR